MRGLLILTLVWLIGQLLTVGRTGSDHGRASHGPPPALEAWPDPSRRLALEAIETFGPPDSVAGDRLVWSRATGRVLVVRETQTRLTSSHGPASDDLR